VNCGIIMRENLAKGVFAMRNETTEVRYLNRRQAASYLGVSLRTFDSLAAARRIPIAKLNRRVLVDRTDLDKAVAAAKQPAA